MHIMAQRLEYAGSEGPPPAALAGGWSNNESVAPQRLSDLEQIYNAHYDRVFRAAYRVTGSSSDAEDVLQTVFLRILKHQHDFVSVDDAGNYLYRAGVNAALDLVRSRKSAPSTPLEEQAPTGEGWKPDRGHHSPELRDKLRDAVAQLHPTAAEMGLHFMNTETYEQTTLRPDLVQGRAFIKEGGHVDVLVDASTEEPLTTEIPRNVELTVTQTDPGVRGDTATGATKPATLESGAVVNVPLFINEGDVVRVDTESGQYLTRVSTS